ncbi:MAG: histidine--tRNA ligase [Planctomycetota bacterium]
MITPRTLKGFRDYLPAVMIPRESMMQIGREVFRSFGYAPIDTPVLEYFEILTGKGSDETDRQMFHFTDNGGREVGMRFDLTVPLARFAAQHTHQLGTPFKRYHIAPVFRGENPQAGRYREFVQADFDTIGTTSVVADVETLTVINTLLERLGLRRFTIRVNNRAILSGLLDQLGLAEHTSAVLRCLDKLDKIGVDAVDKELRQSAGITTEQATQVLRLAQCKNASDSVGAADSAGAAESVFQTLQDLSMGHEGMAAGIERLQQVYSGTLAAGVPADRLRIDVSIARGLDYYTGIIFETILDELPAIGSVCSGGRYDNLAGLYTKQHLPGIGGSLGLDRLVAAMEQLKLLPQASTPAEVLVTQFNEAHRDDYLALATHLRRGGLRVELYPDAKKLKAQLKYAAEKGFRVAVIAGDDEWQRGVVQVKDLHSRQSDDVAYAADAPEELVSAIASCLEQTRGAG